MPEPDELAGAPAQPAARGRSGATVATIGPTRFSVMNSRSILAASSWPATLCRSAASGPPPVASQTARNRPDDARAELLRIARHHLVADLARATTGRSSGGGEQRLLAAEPVVDHRRVHPGPFGDPPHGGAVVAALGELEARGRRGGPPGCPPRPDGGPVGVRVGWRSRRPSSHPAEVAAGARGRGREPARPGWDTDRMTVSSPGRAVGSRDDLHPRRRRRRRPRSAPSPPAAPSSASWPRCTGSSRSRAACSPTTRPRSGSTASSPATGPGTFLLESAENGRSWSR